MDSKERAEGNRHDESLKASGGERAGAGLWTLGEQPMKTDRRPENTYGGQR